jgi:hypothetical protein
MNNFKKYLPFILIIFFVIILALFYIFLKPQKIFKENESLKPKNISLEPQTEEVLNPKDFREALFQLNNPQKVVAFLNKNFELIDEEANHSLEPAEFFNKKKGNRVDLATFVSFVLTQNDNFSTILRYQYLDQNKKEKIKTITLVREKETPLFIDLEKGKLKIYPAGNSIIELLSFEEQRNNVKIIKYAAFNYGTTDFTKGDWLKK